MRISDCSSDVCASDLQAQVRQTQQLLGQAQRIAYDVQQIEQAFSTRYRNMDLNASDQALIDGAQDRWETSVAGFEDALKVQAGVVGNIDGARTAMSNIVRASQSATGALQAAQAGHQLRPDERRVGQERDSKCVYRWSP